ncbi:MAG: hypothetical protein JO064_06590, partial [Actinobacteria bacterium]|nr:hypothetical protein [Actinomycetota bacterium]
MPSGSHCGRCSSVRRCACASQSGRARAVRRRPPSGSTGSPGRRFGRQIRSGTCSWSGTVLKVEAPPVDVVAIVASAGGIAPIERVLGSLPAGLNAAVLVLLHLTPLHPSLLPTILARKTMLRVK